MPKMPRLEEWKKEFKAHRKVILVSLVFLAIALFLNNEAGEYVNRAGNATATDAILDNLPSVNLSFLFVYGFAFVILALFLHPILFHMNEFHIVISQFSLLVMIRSFFITLTHLKVPAGAITVSLPYFYRLFFFQNDLFFSGHTAIPFLGFLLFRKEKIGIFFLIATIVLAATVLFMHLHYSIDVFAAIFIAYGSYKLGNRLFRHVNSNN